MADSNTPPTDTGRFTFESDGFRYEVFRTLLSAWASIEVLADRLLRFGPEDVEHIAHKAPAPLKEIIHRAVRSDPTTRYPSAAEMRDDLRAYLRGLRQPFGAPEAAADLADIIKSASSLERKDAHPVELGVLPWPKASSIR